MSASELTKVNILGVELDHSLDAYGFRHDATTVGERLRARRIGAGVYQAVADVPIWPYHYHHGVEELLFVVDGAPVLREPAGKRTLAAGDLVAFPAGHVGAHTLQGPGRFVIFDTVTGPYMSVYPDSDKISGPGGILRRDAAVSYWHGEGGPSEPAEFEREPDTSPPQPVVNALTARGELPLGAERLRATVVDDAQPYQYVHGRERWLLVLAGTPTLRHPHGEEPLDAGDVVCFPEGPDGAHALLDSGEWRVLLLETTGLPANVHFPDTGEWLMQNVPD